MPGRKKQTNRVLILITVLLCILSGAVCTRSSSELTPAQSQNRLPDMIVADSEARTSDDTGKEDSFSSPSVSPTPAPTEVPAGSQVALTFEDGPDIYTERLLNALEEQDAKATFFVVGDAASDFPDTINRILNTGNELGNHTYSHETLTKLDSSEIPYQINDLNQVIEQLTGTSTDLLRPPYGAVNETVQENSDFPIILWSLDSGDKDTSEIGDIVQKVLENVKDGDIIRMHDTHETSVAAAEVLITELKNRGFELVTVSELARSKGIDLKAGEIYKNF